MFDYFSESSVKDGRLVYEPAVSFRQTVRPKAYEPTALTEGRVLERLPEELRAYTHVEYEYDLHEVESDPYFFLSRYQI